MSEHLHAILFGIHSLQSTEQIENGKVRENCLNTIRFLHTNITNEPLCCISSLSLLIILALVYIYHLGKYLSVSSNLQSTTA
jgi:hypothetical protein